MKNQNDFTFRQKSGAISRAVGEVVPTLSKDKEEDQAPKSTWAELDSIRQEIAAYVMTIVESTENSIALVRANGCIHPKEFEIVANAAKLDLERFLSLYEEIQAKHAGKTGLIADADEHVLMLSIFEEYISLKTLIDGTMQPTLVAFTEYALEAKDLALEKHKQATAAKETQDAK